jgi:hypothetical protein
MRTKEAKKRSWSLLIDCVSEYCDLVELTYTKDNRSHLWRFPMFLVDLAAIWKGDGRQHWTDPPSKS